MNGRQLDYRCRVIKRTYKRYTGERTDGVATIVDVARLFCIELDKSRLDDFYVDTIDFNVPSIVIIDTATMTAYRAEYTSDAKMFHSYGGDVRYVSVTSHNSERTVESLHRILAEEKFGHIATKIILRENDFELIFMREHSHSLGYPGNIGEKFTVGFDKVLGDEEDKKKTRRQPLLTKVHKKFVDGIPRSLDYIFTYSDNCNYIDRADEQDKFVFSDAKSVDYIINEITLKDDDGEWSFYIDGFCFENMSKYRNSRLPLPNSMDLLNEENSPLLYSPKTKSAIHFKGCVARTMWCNFEVYKSNEGLRVMYKAIVGGDNREVKCDDDFFLQVLSPGNISIDEIDSLIEALNLKYAGDEFIRQATMQLLEFRQKICINKGLTLKEEDILSPEVFLGMTMKELEKTVIENKAAYFGAAMEQFQNSTHLGMISPRDIKSFRMIPKKD